MLALIVLNMEETKIKVTDLDSKHRMTPDLVKEYADIKNSIKDLSAKAKEIESTILFGMQQQEMKSFKSAHGTFSMVARKIWQYTEMVVELELQLKSKKVAEEESGTAKFIESPSLRFTAPKNE